jgi:hypothetical protein
MTRARVTKSAMASATMVECNKESDGFGNKSNGNEGGGQSTVTKVIAIVRTTMWAMAMGTRLAGDKEGKGEGNKGDGNVMRVASKKREMAMVARVMATATRVAGKQRHWQQRG